MTTSSILHQESMHGTEQHAGHCCLWRGEGVTRRSTCHPERAQKGFRELFGVSFWFVRGGRRGCFFCLHFLHLVMKTRWVGFYVCEIRFSDIGPFGTRVGKEGFSFVVAEYGPRNTMYVPVRQYRYGVT